MERSEQPNYSNLRGQLVILGISGLAGLLVRSLN